MKIFWIIVLFIITQIIINFGHLDPNSYFIGYLIGGLYLLALEYLG